MRIQPTFSEHFVHVYKIGTVFVIFCEDIYPGIILCKVKRKTEKIGSCLRILNLESKKRLIKAFFPQKTNKYHHGVHSDFRWDCTLH